MMVGSIALIGGLALFQANKPNPLQVNLDSPRDSIAISANGTFKTIRILSWNIDRGKELSTIGSELEKDPGDLYLFQEVDWKTRRTGNADVVAELGSRLHLNFSYGIEFEELGQEQEDGGAYIGQATLTRLPIRKSRILRFQRQSGFWKPHSWLPSSMPLMQRRRGGRIALIDELEFAGGVLVVYNLHLESRSMGRIQAAQLDEIFADLKQYPASTPIIIGGDLNSKYFPSIFLHKLEKAGFHSCLGQKIERTHTIALALDWIFARGPVKLEDGKVRKDMKGSDHYAIYTRLTAE
jgi:endonuclease/exonuclease/phosphatase family metal-dependent hydrolase